METNVRYTIVGIFVISLLAALIFGIIWLSSGLKFEKFNTYMVYMQESVNGLSIDAPVEYNGVAVGTVTYIALNRKDPNTVEIKLNIDASTPITMGTVAVLNTRGVTGITYIALKDKSTDLRPLVALPGQKYPVITAGPSFFTRLDTALSQLAKNFREMSKTIQSVLDPENQKSIKNILTNLSSVTGTLVDNSHKLTTILSNTEAASRQLGPLLQSSIGTMRTIETQTLPSTYRLMTNLDAAAQNIMEVTNVIKQNPSSLIRGVDRPLGPGEKP